MESNSKPVALLVLMATIFGLAFGSVTYGGAGDSTDQLSFWLYMPKSEYMTCESTWLYMFVSNDGEDPACLPISSYSSEEALHYAIDMSLTRDGSIPMHPQLNVSWMGRLEEPCYQLSPADTIVFVLELSGKYGLCQVNGEYPACLPPGEYLVDAQLLDSVSAASLNFSVVPLDAVGYIIAKEYMNVIKSKGDNAEDCLALESLFIGHPDHVLASRLCNSLLLMYMEDGDAERGTALARQILSKYVASGDVRLALIQLLRSPQADSQEILRRHTDSDVPVGLMLRELMRE